MGTIPSVVPARFTHSPALDGLRGVAVLAVLLYNGRCLPGGFLGVDLFFTLSGFLITALLIEEWRQAGSVNFKAFYARRALRLLPALLTMLVITLLLPEVFNTNTRPWQDSFIALGYITNWALAFGVPMYFHEHTWSLTVEEQFYVVWPLTLIALLKLGVRRRWILACVLTGIATSTALRLALWTGDSAGIDRIYYGLDTRFDSLLFGCLAGLLLTWGFMARSTRMVLERIHMAVWPATVVLVVLLLLARNDARVTYSALLTLASAAAAILLLGVTRSQSGLRMWVLENATLGWIGRISYGLYLWHDPIFFHMLSESRMTRVGIIGPMVLVVRFALTFGIAAVSYYLIERPCLRLKNRLAGAA
jgi:peptidoglycan/LPS O-acetylase OafA/YrhL